MTQNHHEPSEPMMTGRSSAPPPHGGSMGSPAAVTFLAACGTALIVFAIAVFVWAPQENFTELTGLMLIAAMITGIWIMVKAARSLTPLVTLQRGGPNRGRSAPEPVSDLEPHS